MFSGTKKDLLDLVKRNGRITVNEVADRMELAKTTLREHFLQLEKDGYLERDYVRSGPGRPSLRYCLTPKGNSLYPSSEPTLLREMISYLKYRGEEETVEQFFEEFWEERLETAQRRFAEASADDPEERIRILMEMLEEEGFMPEFETNEEEETMRVKECNCPFSEAVKETRLPCKLEEMFYKKLFNEKAERITHIAEGDHSCTYDIPASG